MGYRYDDKLKRELQRATKNFNAKVRRLEKKGQTVLPERVSARYIRQHATERRQILREIEKLKAFSVRGAERIVLNEAGVKFTEYEYNRLLQEQANTRRQLTIALQRQQQIEAAAESYPRIKSERTRELESQRKTAYRKDIRKSKGYNLKSHVKQIRRMQESSYRDEIFYQNFFEMLKNTSIYADVDVEDFQVIEEQLRKLSPTQLLEAFRNEPALQSLIYQYNKNFYDKSAGRRIRYTKQELEGKQSVRQLLQSYYDDMFDTVGGIVKRYAS